MKFFAVQNSLSYCEKENKACIRWADKYFKDCLCNMRDELSFGFGLISVVGWGVAEIPQIITNFRTKSAHGVSFLCLLTWVAGDIFNLVGCLLEPATLATQLYTAVFYTTNTLLLVLQSLYYNYFPKGWNGQKKESNQEVEEVKNPLIQPKPIDSAIAIPNGTHSETAPREDYYHKSARLVAGSTSPHIWSYLCPAKSGPSAVGIDNNSSDDEEANPMPAKKNVSRPKPIPRLAGYGAFLATWINKPHVTKALMQVYVGSTGWKLLQEDGIESAYGQWLGWVMAAIYMGGRLPQIWLNIKRGSTEGLNPLMFVFALSANTAYVASILVRSIAWDKLKSNMPWLVDGVGCLVLDLFILLQYVYYRYFSKRCCSGEELGYYIEANKD
ncbi:hypothetical protein Pfo_019476 [Paulownia fortunei]|nr:hypothetical protein Pfo_019476 [Paulownia fortunei]